MSPCWQCYVGIQCFVSVLASIIVIVNNVHCFCDCSAKDPSIAASEKKKLTGKVTQSKRTWEDWVRVEENLCEEAYHHVGKVCLLFWVQVEETFWRDK